jgi:hypothetical protein
MTEKQREMVEAVKAHAQVAADYQTNGWDFVIESYTDEEIAHEINGCNSPENAIRHMEKVVAELEAIRREREAMRLSY